jgi:hypothetical protein
VQRQPLRQVRGCRGLAAAAFEIHHRDDLQMFACASVRQVAARSARALVELLSKIGDIGDRIGSASLFVILGLGTVGCDLPEVAFRYSQKAGGFGGAEIADGFMRFGGKNVAMMGLKLTGQARPMLLNQRLQFGIRCSYRRRLRHSG